MRDALEQAISYRTVRLGFPILTPFAILTYLFILSYPYTGGNISILVQYHPFSLIISAAILGTLAAAAVTANIARIQHQKMNVSTSLSAGFIGGTLTPLLCCSPVIPAVAASLGIVLPLSTGIGRNLQGALATFKTPILVISALLLAVAAYQSLTMLEKGAKTCQTPSSK